MNISETTATHLCGARTRSGTPCENLPVNGKTRCYQHGCAQGAGAPFGNKNAWKHGLYSASAVAERRTLQAYLKEMQDMVKGISGLKDMV